MTNIKVKIAFDKEKRLAICDALHPQARPMFTWPVYLAVKYASWASMHVIGYDTVKDAEQVETFYRKLGAITGITDSYPFEIME